MKKNVFKLMLIVFALCFCFVSIKADSEFDEYVEKLDKIFEDDFININYDGEELTEHVIRKYIEKLFWHNNIYPDNYDVVFDEFLIELQLTINGYNDEEKVYDLTIIHNQDIDTYVFDRFNVGKNFSIKSNDPGEEYLDEYINDYISKSSWYMYDEKDSRSLSLEYEYNDSTNDLLLFAMDSSTSDVYVMDTDFEFVGYDSNVSDYFDIKIGQTYSIYADNYDDFMNHSGLADEFYILGEINAEGYADVGHYNVHDNVIDEIHNVKFNLITEYSDRFVELLNVKKGDKIDFYHDNSVPEWFSPDLYKRINSAEGINVTCDSNSCLYIYNNYTSGIRELRRLPLNKIISEVSNEFNNKIGLSKDIYFGINEDWWSLDSYFTGYSSSDKYTNCYEENSTCDIALLTDDFRIEARNIAINKKEGKSPLANSLFPGDTIEFNSIYMPLNPNDFSLVEEAMRAYIQTMSKGRADMYDITKDTVTISFDEVEHQEYNIKYAKTDSKILSKIENINDKLLSSLKRSKYSIAADDLEFINAFYYNTIGFGNFDTISFNNTLTKIINNKHVNYYYVLHGGAGNKYIHFTGGSLVLYYDGIAYKLFDEHLYQNLNHVIYIPNDTKETTADYVKAAQKRIDDYLGENSGVIISYNGNYDAMDMKNFGSTLAELNIDEDKFDGKEYLIKFGHRSETVLIYKDSNRMKKSTFMANDIKNNINIKSETANYPTNTIVNSNIFDKNDDKHHEHLEKLNFEDGYVVDLSLFSNKLGDINEFDGGNFEVNLPLNDFKYYGLDLYAFYVDDEGNVEKYKVNVDENGFATFETTHFSTYIIADIDGKVGTEVPKTIDVTATPSYNKVKLLWNNIVGATKYVVYRCDSDGVDCVKLITTTSTTYDHSSLGLGKTYYYKVVAYDGSTKLMTSSLVKGKTALSRPVITSVSNNRYQNTIIKWNAVSGATKYYLYRCDSDGSDCKFVDDTTSTSYTTTGGSEGVTYMYKVKAYRSGIYSSTSTGVTGMKLKDSISFSLTKPSYRKINISISHLSTATKYYIYRATSKSGSYSLIATIDATGETLNYLDTVSFNKTYYYKVKASNGVNTTATTSYKYITSNTMDKPVITSVSNNRYQNTIISWNKVNGATSYNVYRCSSTGSSCEKIANTKSTSYTTTGGSEGVTYMYKVKPYVGSTAGITSTGVTGMKLKDSISFSLTKPSYRKINISISHLSTAKKYYIYRATSKSGSYSLIAILEATGETINFLDTVSFNRKYYYKIKANNGVNTSAATGYKYITSNTMDKPVITSVSNNRYQNTIIKWNKVNGATSYNVYRCSDTGSNCEKITNTKSTSYTYTGGSEGVTYMYKVRPYVGSTAGITSNGVTGMKLKDGISFSVKSNSYRAIDITISHLSTAKKYYIYRATSKSGSYSLIATVAATGENIVYTDKSLSFNKTYYYKVKANNGVNTSAATSYKYDKVDGIGKPNVEVSVEDKKVTLNMPKVYGSTGVEIYYSTDGKTYKLLKRTTSTSYTRDLAVGKHYFKVRAYKLYSSKYYYSSYTTLETIEIVDTPEVTPSV